MRKSSLVVVLILGLLFATFWLTSNVGAQTPQPVDVTVTMFEFGYKMSQSTLPANVPIKFTWVNQGKTTHEVNIEAVGAVDTPLVVNGVELHHEDIAPGQTVSDVWTVPAGNWQIGCHIPGHYEAGMVVKFTASGQQGAAAVQTEAPKEELAESAAQATPGATLPAETGEHAAAAAAATPAQVAQVEATTTVTATTTTEATAVATTAPTTAPTEAATAAPTATAAAAATAAPTAAAAAAATTAPTAAATPGALPTTGGATAGAWAIRALGFVVLFAGVALAMAGRKRA